MKVLKNEMFNSSSFQAIHLTKSRIVDSHVTDKEDLKDTTEHFTVPKNIVYLNYIRNP